MQVFAENWKAKCVACGKDVTYPDWKCPKLPGHHKVDERVYFHLGGGHIQNPRERRGWSPQIILRAGTEATDTRTGEKYLVPTIRVIFAGQQVTTQDPEIQFYLETKNDNSIVWGDEGLKPGRRTTSPKNSRARWRRLNSTDCTSRSPTRTRCSNKPSKE